jgi:di/tricarboxylate transporter
VGSFWPLQRRARSERGAFTWLRLPCRPGGFLAPWLLVAIVVVAAILFVTETYTADVVSLLIMTTLVVTRLVTVEQGLSGFSNEATVTVAAFFVITHAIRNTGILTVVAEKLTARAGTSPRRLLAIIIPLASLSSSMLHATGVVAVYMPIVIEAARKMKASASRFLIPLSYAAQFGGVCTLLGTTSNLVVSGIMVSRGMEPLGMFEITKLGLSLFVVGYLYLLLVGWRLVPSRQTDVAEEGGEVLEPYLTELTVAPSSSLVGRSLSEADLRNAAGVDVLAIHRGERRIEQPRARERLEPGDVLVAKATLQNMLDAYARLGLELPPEVDVGVQEGGEVVARPVRLIEVLVTQEAHGILHRSVRQSHFAERWDVSVIGIRRRGKSLTGDMRDIRIRPNDTLMVQGAPEAIARLADDPGFVTLSLVPTPRLRKRRLITLLVLLAGIVGTSATHLVPIAVSTLAAAVFILASRMMTAEQAYDAVQWKVIFLIGGIVPLGLALEQWGVAGAFAGTLRAAVGANPWILLSLVYLVTMIVTEFVTHVACAMIMAPIAITVATAAGLDPRGFCVAVIFAADTSFSTPVGYQTNAMIFGPGGYRFFDFTRVGLPLNILFWLLSSWLIPLFWPLHPAAH